MGMQGRPSSGPAPLMDAIGKIAKIKGTGLKPWLATLYIDHYLAEPVLVGGARRSARMSTKDWRDEDILEFIAIKRPIEYDGMTMEEVQAYQADLRAKGLPSRCPSSGRPTTAWRWTRTSGVGCAGRSPQTP